MCVCALSVCVCVRSHKQQIVTEDRYYNINNNNTFGMLNNILHASMLIGKPEY